MDKIAFRRLMSLVAVVSGATLLGFSHFEVSGSATLPTQHANTWSFHWDGIFQCKKDKCDKEHKEHVAAIPQQERHCINAVSNDVFKLGQLCSANWNGGWYPVEIAQVKDGSYLIHYVGYGCNWDEWVPLDRLRQNNPAQVSSCAHTEPYQHHTYDAKAHHHPQTEAAPPENQKSQGSAPLKAGDHVQIEWHGSWYPGSILKATGDAYTIHYDGYGSNWDETVDKSRIRSH